MPARQRMPARQKKARADAAAFDDAEKNEAQRALCTALKFWIICGSKKCRRSKACISESGACFTRLWALLPPETKTMVRVVLRSSAAGRAPHEIAADIDRERLQQTLAPAADNAAPQSPNGPAGAAPAKTRLRML